MEKWMKRFQGESSWWYNASCIVLGGKKAQYEAAAVNTSLGGCVWVFSGVLRVCIA